MRPKALILAGLDPTGGAGIIADARVLSARGLFPLAVPTGLTVQTGKEVREVFTPPARLFSRSLQGIEETHPISGVKVGMIPSPDIAREVDDFLRRQEEIPVVFDPVLASTGGTTLTPGEARKIIPSIIRHSTLVTPNARELLEIGEEMSLSGTLEEVAFAIVRETGTPLLLTGGSGGQDAGKDLLFTTGGKKEFPGEYLEGKDFHGTGCLLSSALLSYLVDGYTLEEAVQKGKEFTLSCLKKGFLSLDGRWFWDL
ncbi:MAG: hypothetical protein D6713_04780 [Deltaproteobacteria bacterium]|nr:MAG: hypothetical protein D6713_04780 [Deltaproteobacteria bacterium]